MKLNLNNTVLEMTAGRTDQFPAAGIPHVIFSGRSNVGKSSLINTLLGRKSLARVSSSPGKTITVNFYNIDKKLFFVDLPGYGYAKRSPKDKQRWSALTDSYINDTDYGRRLVLQLIDMKAGPTEDDLMMLDWLDSTEMPYFIVATKADKLNKTDRETAMAELSKLGADVVPFSSLKKTGRDEVWAKIYSFLDGE